MNPAVAARNTYDRSVADYKKCIAANPSNINACEGQRHIMESNQQALAATSQPSAPGLRQTICSGPPPGAWGNVNCTTF
jgi:hypothetical protein